MGVCALAALLIPRGCGRERPGAEPPRVQLQHNDAALLTERRLWDPRSEVAGWRGRIDSPPVGPVRVHNPETGVWNDTTAWRLVPEVSIGSERDGPDLFSSIADFAVDAAGRMYVLDRSARHIQVFDAERRFVRTIGREGSGPGEFADPIGMTWDPSGHLWVIDPANGRIAIFDTSGTPLTVRRRSSTSYAVPWRGGFDASGRFFEVTARWDQPNVSEVVWFDDSLRVTDRRPLPSFVPEYFELTSGSGQTRASVPFSPAMVLWFDPRGFLWSGLSSDYRIVQQRVTGDTVRIVERPAPALPVSAEERKAEVRGLEWFVRQGGRVDPARIPATKPAFLAFFVDAAGYLWVQRSLTESAEGQIIDVFDPSGRYLGLLRTPLRLLLEHPPIVRGDTAYAVTTDSLGVYSLVRARIVRGREAP